MTPHLPPDACLGLAATDFCTAASGGSSFPPGGGSLPSRRAPPLPSTSHRCMEAPPHLSQARHHDPQRRRLPLPTIGNSFCAAILGRLILPSQGRHPCSPTFSRHRSPPGHSPPYHLAEAATSMATSRSLSGFHSRCGPGHPRHPCSSLRHGAVPQLLQRGGRPDLSLCDHRVGRGGRRPPHPRAPSPRCSSIRRRVLLLLQPPDLRLLRAGVLWRHHKRARGHGPPPTSRRSGPSCRRASWRATRPRPPFSGAGPSIHTPHAALWVCRLLRHRAGMQAGYRCLSDVPTDCRYLAGRMQSGSAPASPGSPLTGRHERLYGSFAGQRLSFSRRNPPIMVSATYSVPASMPISANL
jgi:hypothetical protein